MNKEDSPILESKSVYQDSIGENSIKVSICCTAFNHEDYIELALQSFLTQKTTFRYEILIHDDASTDRTASIIKKYEELFPDKINCIYQKKNQYSQGKSVGKNLFEIAQGEYIALCEGDDFWIDANKLQIQYDFMNANPDYSLCAHSGYHTYETGRSKNILFSPFKESGTVSTENVILEWLFPTASLFYRRSNRMTYEIPFAKGAPCEDYPLAIYLSLQGKVYYFCRPMCAYRNQSKSSLSTEAANNDEYLKNFNTRIIKMLNNLDVFTDGKFSDTIKFRISQYMLNDIIIKKERIFMLFKNDYFFSLSLMRKIKLLVISCVPSSLFKKINKIRFEIEYSSDRNNQMYSPISLDDFLNELSDAH